MGRGLVKVFWGIVLGIIITVLAAGGGLVYLLTANGMVGKIQESVGNDKIELSDEQKEMSLLDYGKALIDAVSNLSQKEIGELEDLLGTRKLSETISDAVGIAPETVRTSSIGDLGKTISANLTVDGMSDKFSIALPSDIPLFTSDDFLTQPVSEAFGDLSSYSMDNCDGGEARLEQTHTENRQETAERSFFRYGRHNSGHDDRRGYRSGRSDRFSCHEVP